MTWEDDTTDTGMSACTYCGRYFAYEDLVGVIDSVNSDIYMACKECAKGRKRNGRQDMED